MIFLTDIIWKYCFSLSIIFYYNTLLVNRIRKYTPFYRLIRVNHKNLNEINRVIKSVTRAK